MNSAIAQRIGGSAAAMLMQQWLWMTDVRIAHYDRSTDPARAEYDEHCIFVFWHETIWTVLPLWAHTPLTLLVSQHRDAEWLTVAAGRFGLRTVRGSSTRGGSAAIRQLKLHGQSSSFAITPDGPRGPRRQMAAGPVFLASLLDMPLVPVGIGYDRPWRMSTWDQFAVPRLFSRARIVFGRKIFVPKRIRRQGLDEHREQVQAILNRLTILAEQWAESGQRMLGETSFSRARRTNAIRFDKPDESAPAGALRWWRHAA